jgi:hypothetical protein
MNKIILFAVGVSCWFSTSDHAFAMSCESYANSAVSDVKLMKSASKCRVGEGGRWSPDYNAHLNWCKGADQATILSEYQARDKHLLNCGAKFTF